MGAGIAKVFADKFPCLSSDWGDRISRWPTGKTFILVSPAIELYPSALKLVGFPTKFDWRDPTPLALVDRSAKQLYIVAEAMGWKRVLLPAPGCGCGGLNWERQVKPMLSSVLDDRFTVIVHELGV